MKILNLSNFYEIFPLSNQFDKKSIINVWTSCSQQLIGGISDPGNSKTCQNLISYPRGLAFQILYMLGRNYFIFWRKHMKMP